MNIFHRLSPRRASWLSRCVGILLLCCLGNAANAQTSPQNLVGFWWKPTESGWGLSIQQQGTSTFVVWFTFDANGAATWNSLSCTFVGSVCSGQLNTATGVPLPQLTAGANITPTQVGTGSITMTASNRMTLAYTIGNVSQTKTNLEPQDFVAANQIPVCTFQNVAVNGGRAQVTNYTDHWWGGAALSGWGLQISHQGTQVFFGWYHYNEQGKASWVTGIGAQDNTNARRFTGTLYRIPTWTAFSLINGSIPQSLINIVGNFELNFTDGERGSFTHSLTALNIPTRTLPLERLAVAGGAVTVCATPQVNTAAKAEAARFLSQATFGPKMSEIDAVAATGVSAWLEGQFAKPQTFHLPNVVAHLNTLPVDQRTGQSAFQWSLWRNFSTGDDALRQRVAFALSEIFVISNQSSIAFSYPRGPAQYLDNLGTHAFGNYRNLLEAVTYSPMMGLYLSHLRNQKENAATGSVPDENYAREVMQLFTIGLYQLQLNGTRATDPLGRPTETYSNSDVSNLAKVLTGLSWGGPDTTDNRFQGRTADPNREIIPMQAYNQFHSISQKQFLGVTIPSSTAATTNANAELRIALDTLFNHPNVGPFFGKQLIQKLVSSNPSPEYVARVASAFNNNGAGVRGDMKAVLRAVLLDPEARAVPGSVANAGKLREPVVRFVNWMRAFNARSTDGKFLLGTTTDAATQLAQSPMYSPSVFNFFRPGYVPSNTRVGNLGLVSPEAQITHETSIPGYLNYMRSVITSGIGATANGARDIQADYSAELALASNPDALVDRVNLLLAAGNLSTTTRNRIRDAVASVAIGTANPTNDQRNRVNLAIYLTMASPEYIYQP